ncbi:hypothetical protein [Streptomyces sp. SYSU K217416]
MGYLRTEAFRIHSEEAGSVLRFDGENVVVDDSRAERTFTYGTSDGGTRDKTVAKDYAALPAVWVEVVDGWEKDGNWGGYLKVNCVANKGKWIDSSDGWVKSVSSKDGPVTFVDKGDWYEIRQGDIKGRPLVVSSGGRLRFNQGATPGRFNIKK